MAKKQVPQDIKVDLPKKEEPKPERSVAEIQNEYASLAAKAGHLQYQVFTLNKDIDLLNNQMRDLNFEAASLKAKEEKPSNE